MPFNIEINVLMNLSELNIGEKAVIVKVKGHGSFQKRIREMGFIRGQFVESIKSAPFRGPVEYKVMDYHVSLRKNEAKLIEITTDLLETKSNNPKLEQIIEDEHVLIGGNNSLKHINVAFVGNPNCGKTSLFNFASGQREHVGNYSGVTIESKNGRYKQNGYTFNIIDLPGTYSLTAYTPEELYVRKFIFQEHPDIVVNVIDASNLERNLYLTTQLIDMDIKVVIALNMYDDLEKSGAILKIGTLSRLLGIPIIPTIATKGVGISNLFNKIIDVFENRDAIVRHIHINHGREVEQSIKQIREVLRQNKRLAVKLSSRFLAIKLLEQDKQAINMVTKHDDGHNILKTVYQEIERIEKIIGDDSESVITDAKYGFINGALKETFTTGEFKRRVHSNAIDKVLTHKIWGLPFFALFMFIMFYATFTIGSYPMDWIDTGIGILNSFIKSSLPQGMLNNLITDGMISGMGSVLVFLPNIVILFLFISFMEDTGYMARAAFIMDKFMHKLGLHGRSFIPLIMGFGCNVPAIMGTRTIRNHNDRLLTMLIIPFMSCSARLPVYILFIGLFFPKSPALVLLGLYLTGIIMAVIMANIFNKTIFKTKESPFVMELPPYRLPNLKSIGLHMWERSSEYLKKVGGIILIAVVIIWALGYFPRKVNYTQNYQQQITEQTIILNNNNNNTQAQATIDSLQMLMHREKLELSYLGRIGKFIEPVIRPLGFNWHMGISLISGMAAKEVVVGTLGVLLQADSDNDNRLGQQIKELKYNDGKNAGKPVFTPLVAASFLLFVLLYFPCVGVISAIARESGRWKWSFFMMAYTTGLAWVVSFLVYQTGKIFGL